MKKLNKPKPRRKWLGLYVWFSICSVHREYNEACHMCKAGHWQFMPAYYAEHILYKLSPALWRKWANRKNNPTIKRLKKFFPNLK